MPSRRYPRAGLRFQAVADEVQRVLGPAVLPGGRDRRGGGDHLGGAFDHPVPFGFGFVGGPRVADGGQEVVAQLVEGVGGARVAEDLEAHEGPDAGER